MSTSTTESKVSETVSTETSTNNNSNTNSPPTTTHKRKGVKRSLENAELTEPPAKYLKVAHRTPILKVKKLSENAQIPTKGSQYAAGYDLYSSHDCVIEPFGKSLIKTDISILMPIGVYGRIAPRSGISWKYHIDIGAGVIDSDYRGNIGVLMFNHSKNEFQITKHMRIAQLILEKYEYNSVIEQVDELDDTVRGEKGFGSTGMIDSKDSNSNSKDTQTTVATAVATDGVKTDGKLVENKKVNDENEKKDVESENVRDNTNVTAV